MNTKTYYVELEIKSADFSEQDFIESGMFRNQFQDALEDMFPKDSFGFRITNDKANSSPSF